MATSIKYHDACIRVFAVNGATVEQVAEAIGCSVCGLRQYTKRYDIKFLRANAAVRLIENGPSERVQRMLDMYKQGVTLADIGVKFKVTRERVRQLLARHGISAKDGGACVRSKMAGNTKEAKQAAMRARWEAKYGIGYELICEFRANGLIRSYCFQKRSSRTRGIAWRLTFAQWYAIWQASGKLHLRGTGKGRYCMSRLEDSGCYELGNVHVQLIEENSREGFAKGRGRTKAIPGVFCIYPGRELAWLAKVGKVNLGFHASAEAAGAARDKYIVDNNLTQSLGGLGKGRGYTVLKTGKKPYQVQAGKGFKAAYFATPEEARAEYLRRCDVVKSTRAHAAALEAV